MPIVELVFSGFNYHFRFRFWFSNTDILAEVLSGLPSVTFLVKLNRFLIKKLKFFTTRRLSCDWLLGTANQIVACKSDVVFLPRCFCTLPFGHFKWFRTLCVICITQVFSIFIQCPIFAAFQGQSRSHKCKVSSYEVKRALVSLIESFDRPFLNITKS